ncbi:MAG: SUMF1/EgtB/PvdO family nonheme iron enzyme [Anaerolineales bacterium]|nr:SUMF1/EgtB/PvdO family nonheme iron enzyme [Anaerolineales bacterium]
MTQMAPRPQQSWIGQTIGGRYKIEALLGHGGMSTVYQATDPNLRRTVAIKLIHPHLSNDPQFVRRFEQEAAAVAQLRHPNIIQVFDFAHDEGIYYMVLEYLPGETLQARLTTLNAAHQRMPLNEIIQTMAAICDAVAYAHQRNMIHRDLKPANVMLNPQGQPILMDFGVAKMLGEVQHTATGAVVGTALYMSPEQARGERPDERSDIYSLGVMLYEMITGVPPFKADSAVSLMMQHVTQPVPDIRQVNQTVPDLLVAVTKKALAKDANERYRTASDMAATLRAIDTSGRAAVTLPVKSSTFDSTVYEPAGPVSGGASAVIPPRKNNLPLVLGGLATVLVLLVVVGVALFFLFRPNPGPTDGEEQVIAGPEDAVLPSSEKMIKIGAGTYTIGRDAPGQNYVPPQEIELNEFWIDQYEVSNAQYAQFLADTKNQPPAAWPNGEMPADQADFPAQGVSWTMANGYCQWIKKRLPSEAEWEVAARGPEARLFPWGNDPKAVELPRSGTYKIGSTLTNQSAFGVFDMAGNVWEWVGETYTPVQTEGNHILRGGENGLLKDMAFRLEGPPDQESIIKTAGIRCAAAKVELAQPQLAQVEGVLVEDNFADTGSGWPVLSDDKYILGYHPPDYYHVQVGVPNDSVVVSRAPDFEDATVETEVLVDHTDTDAGNYRYGLVLRRNGDDQFYAFVVSSRTGTWQVLKRTTAGLETLAEGKIETLQGFAPVGFTPDKTDTLRVDAKGADFVFQINGQPIAQVTDGDYKGGEVGFYVETFDETLTHVHYESLTVREVEFEAIAAVPTAEIEVVEIVTEEAAASPTPPPTATPVPEPSVEPTATSEPPTPTDTAEPPTPTTAPSPTPVLAPDGMVLIPAGSFLMGSSTGQPNEAPEHAVSLDAFYLDIFEVSNAQYRACVADGGCTPGSKVDSFTYKGYRDDPTYNDYPMVGVTWDQAAAYCRWAGKRLPTEAEWEYAASGPENLIWPWGNTFNAQLSAASAGDTQPVASYADGVSPFGVYNMAGNVGEWVEDVYNETFYANSPASNPVSTGDGTGRIFRGGSFANPDGAFFTTSRRYGNDRTFNDVDVGFRCAQDAL